MDVRLTLTRETWRGLLTKVDMTERDFREMPQEKILVRARGAMTKWEYALFADELKRRRRDAA